jgi:Tol biopolymer transport system component
MIGQTISHYQVLEKLGAGGMGEVYRARDSHLGRDVAIKVLPDAFAREPDRLARFEQEARLLAALNHPNIAAIYGLEQADGRRFLVLELVPGSTLAERLAAGSLPVEEALEVERQVAEALEAAHGRGIIHRDLKPANIKVTPEGKVKVLDFGLAKAFGPDVAANLSSSPTATYRTAGEGLILGTAAYMSPEQARGRPLDPRTDIWSFGCVLYEALTGHQAFSGETISDTLAAILKGEPEWNALPVNTPPNIHTLLRRCLHKDMNRRLQHIGDARIEIEETLSGAALWPAAPASTEAPRARTWRRALPWALAGLFALTTIIANWQVQRTRRQAQNPAMHFSVVTNFAGVEAQPSLSPDGRSVAFVSDRGGQSNIWVGLVAGGSPVPITKDPNLKSLPRWSPDGSKLAYARLNEAGIFDIWIVPALGGTARKILVGASDPAWSPDGRFLAFANYATGTIWICDATGNNPRQFTQQDPSFPYFVHRQPAYSRDGRQMAFVRRRPGPYGELYLVEVATGKTQALTRDGALALSPVWSPGNEFIYFASSRGGAVNVWRIPARGGQPEQVTASQGDDAELDLSEDGKRLVFSTYRVHTNLVELTIDPKAGLSGTKSLTSDAARNELVPAYSPDGKRIAYFTNRKGAENEAIWVMGADGSDPVQVVEDERVNVFPRWSGNGQSLVYGSRRSGLQGDLEVRRVALSGQPPEKLALTALGQVRDSFGDVARDGRLVFYNSEGKVQVFDPGTKQTRVLEGVRGVLHRWSGDGRRIAYIISPSRRDDPEAGLWVYDFQGEPHQVLRGWIAWYAWAGGDELFVVAGKPDLKAWLWRLRLDGTPPQRIPGSVQMVFGYSMLLPSARFDVHPDHRHIAIEATELNQANIGMIENVR